MDVARLSDSTVASICIGIDDSGKISELTVPKNAPDSNYW